MTEILEPGEALGSMELTGEHGYPVTASAADEPNGDGTRTYWIDWAESLDFHRERTGRPLTMDDLGGDQLAAIRELVEEEMGGDVDLAVGIGPNYAHDPDELALTIHLALEMTDGTTIEELAEAAWPFIATCINVCDPGTFGSRYIMSALPEGD